MDGTLRLGILRLGDRPPVEHKIGQKIASAAVRADRALYRLGDLALHIECCGRTKIREETRS